MADDFDRAVRGFQLRTVRQVRNYQPKPADLIDRTGKNPTVETRAGEAGDHRNQAPRLRLSSDWWWLTIPGVVIAMLIAIAVGPSASSSGGSTGNTGATTTTVLRTIFNTPCNDLSPSVAASLPGFPQHDDQVPPCAFEGGC